MSRYWLLALSLVAGCGRYGFDAIGTAGPDAVGEGGNSAPRLSVTVEGVGRVTSTPPGIDCPGTCEATFSPGTVVQLAAAATNPDVWFQGWTGICQGRTAACTIELDADRSAAATWVALPNRAFITTTDVRGDFGGRAAADAICASAASNAGLVGTFVSWVSTSTTDAIDRLRGSRGWIRPDGVAVADTLDELVTGRERNPINVGADGSLVTATLVFSGTAFGGLRVMGETCSDWTSTLVTGATVNPQRQDRQSFNYSCAFPGRLICFETGRVVPIAPAPEAGRVAFVSRSGYTGTGGAAALDAGCQADAVAAGFSGTFGAAAGLTSSAITARFPGDAVPWRRPDGTLITSTASALFDGSRRRSFIHQHADGEYITTLGALYVSTGVQDALAPASSNDNCDDWTSERTIAPTRVLGRSSSVDGGESWRSDTNAVCAFAGIGVICLER